MVNARRSSHRYWLRLILRAGSFGRFARPVARPRNQTEPVPSRPLLRALPVVLAVLALPQAAAAQERIHRTYSVDDGLVESQVLSVFEDRDGYLWLGTFSGVSRFDGVAFTNFQAPSGPPSGPVNSIAQAADGTLLFGTERGMGIYSGGRWTVAPALSGLTAGPVRSIVRAPDGSLLATSWRNGIVARRPDGRFAALPLPGTPEQLHGLSLLAGRDGTLWLGTFSQGLWAFRDGRLAGHWNVGQGLPGPQIAGLAEGPDGAVYAGTAGGLAVYRGGTLAPLPGWPATAIRKVTFGSDGLLYAGTTTAGLLFGRPDRPPARIDTGNGLPSDQVNDVGETRGGTMYVGTERGVSPFDRGRLTDWLPRHGLPDSVVWGFAEEPGAGAEGRILVATGNGIAALENGRMTRLGLSEGLPDRAVRSLWLSPSGRLYAGTAAGGVAIVEHGRVVRTLGTADGLASLLVLAIREGRDGTVYFGTQDGLSIWRDGRFTHLGVKDGLPLPTVNALALAPDGALYLATMGGLARWDGRALRVWTERDGLPDQVVWSVTLGPDGAVYAGTGRGLSILRDGRFTTFDTRRGLTDNTIYCSLLDAAGRVYVSTDRGVDLIDPRVPPGRPAVVRTLRRDDGLAGDEGALGACHQDAAGRLWFGTIAGAAVYDPTREPARPKPPRVHIAGLELFGRALPTDPCSCGPPSRLAQWGMSNLRYRTLSPGTAQPATARR